MKKGILLLLIIWSNTGYAQTEYCLESAKGLKIKFSYNDESNNGFVKYRGKEGVMEIVLYNSKMITHDRGIDSQTYFYELEPITKKKLGRYTLFSSYNNREVEYYNFKTKKKTLFTGYATEGFKCDL